MQEDYALKWKPEEDEEEVWHPGKVYYVPFSEVALNIQNFINTHQNVLELKGIEPKKTEAELLDKLVETQYKQLVLELRWYESMFSQTP